jgi:hypothetical protein
MSRLDSFIARMQAQRDCLNFVKPAVDAIAGPILEVGLGNGRTYDHLRSLFPVEDVFVFDREIAAHPSCIPPAGRVLLGDFRDSLDGALAHIGRRAMLAHCDFGSGDPESTAELARFLGPALAPLVEPGGFVVSDQRMTGPGWRAVAPPATVEPERYFIWQVDGP